MLADLVESLIVPPGLIVVLLVVAAVLLGRRRPVPRTPLALVSVAAAVLYAVSTPFVPWLLGSGLENRYPPYPDVSRVDAIVVLGGGLVAGRPSRQEAQLMRGATLRTLAGADLWRRLHVPVVPSGGGSDEEPRFAEAEVMAKLLQSLGVPEMDVIKDDAAGTTAENADGTVKIAKRMGWKRVAVVSSAMHMRRSVLAFEHRGLEVVAVPVDYQLPRGPIVFRYFLPDSHWIDVTRSALHERIGLVWYRLRGEA